MVTGGPLADVWPLTAAQEGLLYHAMLDPQGPDAYVVQCRFAVRPPVDGPALRAAVAGLLDRYPNLRACFRHKGLDRPVQVVPHRAAVPWTEVDLSAYAAAEADELLARLLAADRARRFDLTRPPLLRCTLVDRGADGAELVLTLHHILVDGWSMAILAGELAARYEDSDMDLPAAPHFRDYLAWLNRQDRAAAARAWQAALSGVPRPTRVAEGMGARPPLLPETVEHQLPAGLSAAVRRQAGRVGVTVNTLAQAAWGLVLARMTGCDDVVFDAVVSGRPPELPGVEAMVGLLVNSVPVRVRLPAAESAGELLARLQGEQLRLVPYHHVRAADLTRLVGDVARPDTLFAFENFPRGGATGPDRLRLVEVRDANHQPLTLVLANLDERLWLRLQYRPDCWSRAEAGLVMPRLVRAFELLTADPHARLDQLDVLPPAEREQVLVAFHGAARPARRASIVDRITESVRRDPQAPAVHAPDGVLSYAELDARADRLAARLAAAGARPETAVALLMDRSADLVVAQLAVLKAGAFYVPLDPEQPRSRLTWLLRDAGARLVLTDRPHSWLPDGVRALTPDDAAAPPPSPQAVAPHPDSAACVMYTSGSTGAPKGVVVTHHNVVELAADRRFATGGSARILLHNPHTFDAVTYELWVPLLTGGTVVVAPPGRTEPVTLRKVIGDGAVTALCLTPELLRVVLDLAPDALAGLREVWPAGDVVAPETIRRTQAACPDAVVVNGYGPTETTTFATCHRMRSPLEPGLSTVPIGEPLDNTAAYVLDDRLRPVPVGTAGELYLGGTGLARGYLNQPARTAERFVAAPYAARPGARMYRTGDLVRWTPDGVLEFVGRADDQVKVRGFRVEPGEIESVLEECPPVRRAVVAVKPGPTGGKRLIAYLDLEPDADLDLVRRHASQRLPGHLTPDGYQRIDRIPLSAHGKVDRSALPEPAVPAATSRAAARSPQEAALRRAFATVLRVPDVAADDNFFAAGGDSLLAMRLSAEIEAALGIRVAISALFDAPTPAALATRLDSGLRDLGTAPLLTLRHGGAGLFCVHPAMGLGWSYTALLPYLAPGRGVYALQSPALDGHSPPPDSLELMAQDYVDRLRTVQPHGPYALVGRSFGGPLAYQMAVRLRQAGEAVELLAVLDAVPPRSADEPSTVDADLVERESLRILLQTLPRGVPAPARLDRAEVFAAVQAGGLLAGTSHERLSTMVDLCAHHIRLVQCYEPPHFDGRVVLFSATAQPGGRTSAAKAAAWRRTAAEVDLYEVDCAHSEVLTPGPAGRIAAVLDTLLKEL
jgi:amino acid adenylation domain-containing protein